MILLIALTPLTRPILRSRGKSLPALLLATLAAAPACAPEPARPVQPASPPAQARDPHSFGRPDQVRTAHADIDWIIDFGRREIRGSVAWTVERAADAGDAPLILDTRGLTVESVTAADGAPIPFDFADPHPALGTALRIHLAPRQAQARIAYRTGPDSDGIQWLAPAQTAGGRQPYLFTQAQSILARTFVPCQDSPGVRITFSAQVKTPPGLRAVMAAKMLPRSGEGGPYRFEMPQPIPSYLIALAAGDVAFRELGPRSGVYAEPSVLDAAAYEFADTEAMIDATEKLYGPYRWERYDLLVLPPSFPFGGMENPRLTFATPTVLAGDRSLVSLVAHELAHSWSGNLVTNSTWSDFWLNEGFTVFLERRILGAVYGPEAAEMGAVLGKQDLLEEMPALETGFTALYNRSLEGRDPDDAFSEIPYEKGYLFLRLLDEAVGRERFDRFLRSWFDGNAFHSRTTQDFERAVRDDLLGGDDDRASRLHIHEWLYAPGLPDNAPEPRTAAFDRTEEAAAAFVAGERAADDLPGTAWTTQEWLHFLRALPADLPAAKMKDLDAAWSFTRTGNSEILMQWLLQSIRCGYGEADGALESFLTRHGRRKFLKPLYTELAKTDDGRRRALAIYARARPGYHSVSSGTIDEILGWPPEG